MFTQQHRYTLDTAERLAIAIDVGESKQHRMHDWFMYKHSFSVDKTTVYKDVVLMQPVKVFEKTTLHAGTYIARLRLPRDIERSSFEQFSCLLGKQRTIPIAATKETLEAWVNAILTTDDEEDSESDDENT